MHSFLFGCVILHVIVSALGYSIPEPKLELLNPKGFRISIPDESDIILVAYHMNIKGPILLNQPGEFSAEITKPTDGRWVFDNIQVFVNPGDKIGYWVHVQHRHLAYRKLGSAILSGDPVDIIDPVPPPKRTCPAESVPRSRAPPTNCAKSATTVNRKPVCKGELIFEDNFDSLNLTVWKREVRMSLDQNDAAFVSYQSRSENCYVNDGKLHIVPNLLSEVPGFNEASIRSGRLDLGTECTGIVDSSQECTRQAQFSTILPPIVSARISTKNFFAFRYGRVEVRAKMPKGDWLYPLILLEPLENYYGFTGYASGEMRVAYIRGNELLEDRLGADIAGTRVFGGVVLGNTPLIREFGLMSSSRRLHLGDDYHTYTLIWAEDHVSLEIDGNEYAFIRGGFSRLHRTHNLTHAALWDNGNAMAPFDREFYLTLGVAAGGHSDFPDRFMNGKERIGKPWRNRSPKAELNFWNDRENWLKTWSGNNVGLHVSYVKVYAL